MSIVPYDNEQLEFMELHLGVDKELAQSSGSRLKKGKGQVTLQWGSATGHLTRKSG